MPGIIKGKVIVIKKPGDYYKIADETIIVAKNTHPDVVIVIKRIKAIVTEVENRLCHAAIISREYGKPLLMGIKNITREFKTGDRVKVDFANKKIEKIK